MILFKIIQNEWQNLWRSKLMAWLLAVLITLSVFAIWQTTSRFKDVHQQRSLAMKHMRDRFTKQGAVNPHGAAHYGHFVYKPMTVLSIMDEGVNPYTGISLRLEAHKQNQVLHSFSQNSSSLIRFGALRLNLVLQILFPLFIVFACHNAISKEKENRILALILSQGVTVRQLIWGKTIAYVLVWWMVLCFTMINLWIATKSISEPLSLSRLAASLVLYGIYYFILTTLSIYASALMAKSGNVLLMLLSAWFVCTILLPKVTTTIGEDLSPLITKLEMERRISEDNRKGINGHDPQDQRAKRFKENLLKKYGVDTVSKLTVNVDGLIMQADEQYHNIVYDRHFGHLQQTIQRQNNATAVSSYINPFAAVRNLSMALAGTDVYNHFNFSLKAEQYRRMLIKKLNEEMAYGGSKTGDWDWTVKPDYWEKINDFHYAEPSMAWSLQHNKHELIALLCWFLATVLVIHFSANFIRVI